MSVSIVQSVRDRIECMRIRPLLQAFVDGALDDEQRRRVAAHLEACRRCGLETSTYRSLKERLRGLGLARRRATGDRATVGWRTERAGRNDG